MIHVPTMLAAGACAALPLALPSNISAQNGSKVLERQIAALVLDLGNPESDGAAMDRLVAYGPQAVPALTAFITRPEGQGDTTLRCRNALQCLGRMGAHAKDGAWAICNFQARHANYNGFLDNETQAMALWATAQVGPFAEHRPLLINRLRQAHAKNWFWRRYVESVAARVAMGPQPSFAQYRHALEDITPEAVGLLWAINDGACRDTELAPILFDRFEDSQAGTFDQNLYALYEAHAQAAALALTHWAPDDLRAIPAWIHLLGTPDAAGRRRAAFHLVNRVPHLTPEEFALLCKVLLEQPAPWRADVVTSVASWGERLLLIAPAFTDDEVTALWEATQDDRLQLLLPVPRPGAAPAPAPAAEATDQVPWIVQAAVHPASATWPASRLRSLGPLLSAPSGLEHALFEQLVEALQPSSTEYRMEALKIIVALGPRVQELDPGPWLSTVFRPTGGEQVPTAKAVAALDLPPNTPAHVLVEALRDPRPGHRLRAAQLFKTYDLAQDQATRQATVDALRIAMRAEIPRFFKLLDAQPKLSWVDDGSLYSAAALALTVQGAGSDAEIEGWERLLECGTEPERRRAIQGIAVSQATAHERMVLLVNHLDDANEDIAIQCARALGAMKDPAAQEAIPDLEWEMEDTESDTLRAAYAEALRQLRDR